MSRSAVGSTESAPGPSTSGTTFRPDIEGLRAVAVLAVVLFHAGLPGVPGGFVGVDVFFVISGFLITGMLWREAGATGTVSLRRFWGARARRLLPASATVGVITLIASALLLSPLQVKTVSIDAITSALYVSNYWFAASGINYFGKDTLLSPSPFKHYWSLGVEEQFYLVWPVLIIAVAWLVRRRRGGPQSAPSVRPYLVILAFVSVASFALALVSTYVMPPVAYFSLPTRAWQLAAGGVIALTVRHWRRLPGAAAVAVGWAGLALILIACVRLSSLTPYPGSAALLPTLGTALVIGAGCAGSPRGVERFLGLPPMRAIGRVSYSWYLWHWPVLVFAPVLVGHPLGLPATLLAVAVSAGLAVLTLRYIENPLRFAPHIKNSPRNSLLLGAVATATAVAVGAVPLVAVPAPAGHGPAATPVTITAQPAPPGSSIQTHHRAVREVFAQFQAAVAESVGLQAVPSNLRPPLDGMADQINAIMTHGCLLLPFQADHPECIAGDPASSTTVALIGDSRGAMFNAGFQRAAEQQHWRLLMMSKAACPIAALPLTAHFDGFTEALQRCTSWRDQIMARLQAERPQLIVVSTARLYGGDGTGVWQQPGFDHYDDHWISGLAQTVRSLRGTGAQVLILGAIPDPIAMVPNCLSAHLDDVGVCAASPSQSVLSGPGAIAERTAVEANGGHYAALTDLFCTATRCPPIIGDTMVYYDGGHITREYSEVLAPAIGALAALALAHG